MDMVTQAQKAAAAIEDAIDKLDDVLTLLGGEGTERGLAMQKEINVLANAKDRVCRFIEDEAVDPDMAADVAAELAALRREERAEEEQLREWDR